MSSLPLHYYADAICAVLVWTIAWRLSLGNVTAIPGLRIGRPKDPQALAGKLALRLALMPLPVIAADAYALALGDAGGVLSVIRIGAVIAIAVWIMQTIQAAQK